MFHHSQLRRGSSSAFSLVEVALAMGIAAFALVTILGLLGGALQSNSDSERRMQAANLATLIIAQYQAVLNSSNTPAASGSPLPHTITSTTPPSTLSAPVGVTLEGTSTASLSAPEAAYALKYAVWKSSQPSGDSPYILVNCALKLQWPAGALANDPDNEQTGAYEVTTSFLVPNLQ